MNKLISIENIADINSKINDFEKEKGINLSDIHKKNLLVYNVSKPQRSYYKTADIEFEVIYFLGFSEDKYRSISHVYDALSGRIPNGMLPIADAGGGNFICMSISDGSIYYWSHEINDWGLEDNEEYPSKIANNINDFLEYLRPSVEPSKELIEKVKKEGKVKKITPIALKFKNEARAKKGLPPLTMNDFQ